MTAYRHYAANALKEEFEKKSVSSKQLLGRLSRGSGLGRRARAVAEAVAFASRHALILDAAPLLQQQRRGMREGEKSIIWAYFRKRHIGTFIGMRGSFTRDLNDSFSYGE